MHKIDCNVNLKNVFLTILRILSYTNSSEICQINIQMNVQWDSHFNVHENINEYIWCALNISQKSLLPKNLHMALKTLMSHIFHGVAHVETVLLRVIRISAEEWSWVKEIDSRIDGCACDYAHCRGQLCCLSDICFFFFVKATGNVLVNHSQMFVLSRHEFQLLICAEKWHNISCLLHTVWEKWGDFVWKRVSLPIWTFWSM